MLIKNDNFHTFNISLYRIFILIYILDVYLSTPAPYSRRPLKHIQFFTLNLLVPIGNVRHINNYKYKS